LANFNYQNLFDEVLVAMDDLVYLTMSFGRGLQIIDVSAPAAPVLKSTHAAYPGPVHFSGEFAFSGSGFGQRQLLILDPRVPTVLRPRGSYDLPDYSSDVQLVSDLLFVADAGGGLQILRIHPDRFPPDFYIPLAANSAPR
jgi:hypothetical protein